MINEKKEGSDLEGAKRIPGNISAVVPAYNSALYLKSTVESLLQQTYPLFEIIIVDDRSEDATYSLCMELEKSSGGRVHAYRLARNCGPSLARNIGMELAHGEWVLFMDHDDIAEPQLVELELQRLSELEAGAPGDWVLVHSAYGQMGENGERLAGVTRWRQVAPEEMLGYLLVRNPILTASGVLLRKEAALRAGAFDPAWRYSQDWDLWLRLAQLGGFGYVDTPLIWIRRHSSNLSRKICNFETDEKAILKRYEISFIEEAIHCRRLPWEVNRADFVSVLYRLDHWEEGFRAIKEVTIKQPGLPAGFFLSGLYYLRNNNWLKARFSFERTLELAPEHGAAMNNLGAILALRGDYEKAKNLFVRAISLFPGYLDATHNLLRLEEKRSLHLGDVRFTWRELRPVLLTYAE